MASRAVVTEKKLRQQMKTSEERSTRLIIYLSPRGKQNLEELRLRSLDKRGRKPSPSEILEALVNVALGDETVPYPA